MASLALLTEIDPTAAQAPAAIVPLATAAFSLSLCLNFMVTLLIVGRIWYTMSRDIVDEQDRFDVRASGVAGRAIGVMVESGLLFLVIQFIFVVLFAIEHSSQAILVPAAMQIYVRELTLCIPITDSYSQFAGHCTHHDHRQSWDRLLLRADHWCIAPTLHDPIYQCFQNFTGYFYRHSA